MNDEDQQALSKVAAILDREAEGYRNLIAVLQEVQAELGYLPTAGMRPIAERFKVSPVNVLAVASFYNQFKFAPPGRRHVKVCLGTACHIKQGQLVMDQWKRRLELEDGGRTADGEYSLERVACVGACALAPVSVVADETIGTMSPTKVDGILLQDQIQREQAQRVAKKRAAKGAPGEDGDGGGDPGA